jgi:hypothetical protein
MKDEIVLHSWPTSHVEAEIHTDEIPVYDNGIEIAQWYWVSDEEETYNEKTKKHVRRSFEWIGCVTTIGSNYIELTGVSEGKYDSTRSARVHVDEFDETCRREMNPEAYIQRQVHEHQTRVNELMGEVRRITASLFVPVSGVLPPPAAETTALMFVGKNENIAEYKQALIKAKTETLPALFAEIEETNRELGHWMGASLIPLRAEAASLTPAIKAIESRIFNVELYAGLSEEVVQIADGEPAYLTEKIVLFQRRAYMDEECLADYEVGGMDFKKIEEFDRWLKKPSNVNRILPFPRCIIAFKVRRKDKARSGWTYDDFVRIQYEKEMDNMTFLYIRNGERLYCLRTAIEFDEKLFPDIGNLDTSGRLYVSNADRSGGKVYIDEHDYVTQCEEYDRHKKSEKGSDGFGGSKSCLCRTEQGETYCKFRHVRDGNPRKTFTEFNDQTVYYDDIKKDLDEQMAKHNRVVLVLQGLLDRSEILQPHPPWKLNTPEGFDTALKLVFDIDKALTDGDKPDFEAYRAKLNASIKTGSITVGQDLAWAEREAARENARRRNSRGYGQGYYDVDTYRPHGDPGPGDVARVSRFSKKNNACTFKWTRQAQRGRWLNREWGYPAVACSIDVAVERLFNVEAYTPGDYKQFFNDPRTRADYLEWAPYMLEAEEYHAGNRKVGSEPAPAFKKPRRYNECDPPGHIWLNGSKTCQCGENKTSPSLK